jgi:XapX domain-containing protein
MKLIIGLILAVFIGIGCRFFDIPLPGPPAIFGALMAVAMATGYTVTDYAMMASSPPKASLTVGSGGASAGPTETPAGQSPVAEGSMRR